jgi:hypothetical protein
MNVEPAIQFTVPQLCPSPTRSGVVVIRAFPGELHAFTFGSGLESVAGLGY